MRGTQGRATIRLDLARALAQLDAEKQPGSTSIAKFDIERMGGVARFYEVCRTTVMRYTHEWRGYVTRQARWVDVDQSVKTHDLDYMESVIWGCGRRPVPTARPRVHMSMRPYIRLRARGDGSVEVFRARPIRRPIAPRSGRPRRAVVRSGNSPGRRTAPRQLR